MRGRTALAQPRERQIKQPLGFGLEAGEGQVQRGKQTSRLPSMASPALQQPQDDTALSHPALPAHTHTGALWQGWGGKLFFVHRCP